MFSLKIGVFLYLAPNIVLSELPAVISYEGDHRVLLMTKRLQLPCTVASQKEREIE